MPNAKSTVAAHDISLSGHILPTSATMLGVCITSIGLVRLMEVNGAIGTTIDNVIAADSVLFLVACISSYSSIRSARHRQALERAADITFMVALVVIAVACLMLAWEVGYSPRVGAT